ncbi:transmembrane protein 203-like isoform X2 [Adelges cooleyi]|uniref:transmembrane protein 203-like isoform X2 n=1 Tax=Adelges cooleyi TaxID=133065 RepID=UPI00217F8158|nr:transmembrane protein 203-like isoform X2 [Adelges cooleyi]
MLFALQELVRWLGLTIFEMLVHLLALLIFTIFLALRLDGIAFASSAPNSYDMWIVFSPLFVADALCIYFNIIVLIRLYIEGHIKEAVTRTIWSSAMLFVWSLFKVLLCRRLAGLSNLDYSEIMSPIFLVLQLIAIRACQLH